MKGMIHNRLIWLIAILAVMLGAAMCTSCNKHLKLNYGAAVTGEVKLHAELDTTTSTQKQTADSSYREHEEERKTQEAVPGDSTGLTLTPAELKPVVDANGDTTGRTFTARKGRTEVSASVDRKGNLKIDCKTDSLKREVEYFRKESSYQAHRSDSMQTYILNALLYREVKTDSSIVYMKEDVKGGGGKAWLWVGSCVICLVMGGIIGFKLG